MDRATQQRAIRRVKDKRTTEVSDPGCPCNGADQAGRLDSDRPDNDYPIMLQVHAAKYW